MGELTGIAPAGANALLKALSTEAAQLTQFVSAVRSAVSEAGSDLDPAASGADQALQRYQRVLDYWSKDLKWRIQMILAMTNSSPFDKLEITAELPYRDYLDAQRAGGPQGKAEGDKLKDLWGKYQRSQRAEDLQAFKQELALLDSRRFDPYYSGALLKALGKDTFGDILRHRISPIRGTANQEGNTKAGLNALRQELGPLADMFAAADHGATLPSDIRNEALNADAKRLAIFLRLTDNHTDQFALDAAKHILRVNPIPTDTEDGVAARRILLDELWRRPGVTQMLLQDPNYTRDLYFPQVTSSAYPDQYQEELAAVLWKTLGQDVGDQRSQLGAWRNIVKVGGEREIRDFLSRLPDQHGSDHPNLAEVLAIRFKPYLPWLSYLQATQGQGGDPSRYSDEFSQFRPNAPGIPGLTSADARDFFAGLISSKTGQQAVVDVAKEWVRQNPALSDDALSRLAKTGDTSAATQHDIRGAMLNQDGFLALLLRSGKVANLDHDSRVDFTGQVIGVGAGYTPVLENPLVGAALNKPIKLLSERLVGGEQVDPHEVGEKLHSVSLDQLDKQLDGLDVPFAVKQSIHADVRDAYYANLLKPLYDDK